MRWICVPFMIVFAAGCAEWGALTRDALVADETMARVKAAKSQYNVTAQQRADFGFLADFAGRTFRGESVEQSAGGVADIQFWHWSEDGKGLVVKHRLVDGSYGGNSLITRNRTTGKLSYTYKTNAGFGTYGDFTLSDAGSWEAVETVTGQSDITKVRSRGHIRDDGALISTSDYFKNGEWVPGNRFIYREVWQDLPILQTPIDE